MCESGLLANTEAGFGLRLLSDIGINQTSIISPVSILLSLSLVHLGAKGYTQNQIRDAITNGSTHEDYIKHFSSIYTSIKNDADSDVETNIANRLFVGNDQEVDQNYLSNIGKHYGSYAEKIDFGNTKGAAEIINKFIGEETKGKIKNMVESDSLRGIVGMIVNAVHFEGDWKYKFDKDSATEEEFFENMMLKRKVKFLKDSLVERKYSSDDLFEVLQIPYKDRNFNFVVFLPKKRFGLKDALSKMDSTRFYDLIRSPYTETVNFAVPKFKIEKQLNLGKALEKFGLRELFTEEANLSGISPGLKLSAASHQAMIEVDEWGTRAAAATEVKIYALSAPAGPPINFKADHPFLFAVVKHCTPIFMGIYT